MRLQSIQIKGFKSFANNTLIYFNENVTGIVGPNGSGKSNIIDAIRWVLGEQKSKELRLAKMQDVIFNGTAKKKAANTAEVSITFENTRGVLPSEYHFIKISRILYRSGESEYRLNDVTCRLKDIHSLLLDSGVGSNSYAIIELGMVDDILQDKDKARRKMFEQAAGISKYKKRKRETLSKLSLTQADLDRVDDLLHEISVNLNLLEKQAKRSRKYLAIKEEYKESSLLYHQVTIDQLLDQKLNLKKEITKLTDEYTEIRKLIDVKESTLEKEKLQNLHAERQLSAFQQKISDLTDHIRTHESRKEILKNQIKYATDRINSANKKIEINGLEKEKLSIQLEDIKSSISKHEYIVDDAREEFEDAQDILFLKKSAFDAKKTKAEKLLQEKQEIQYQIQNLEKKIAINENKLIQLDNAIKHHQNTIQSYKVDITQFETEIELLKDNIDDKQRRLEEFILHEQQKESQIKELRMRLEEHNNDQRKLLRQIDISQNDANLLESIINQLEGFPEAMKYLNKKWKGAKVILSDIIECPEEYRPAVELFFGPWLDYFIVENEQSAIEAIEILAKANQGRAHFFVLDKFKNIDDSSLHVNSLGVSINSIIRVEPKYQPILDVLCSRAFIVEEFPANPLENLLYVTKDGTKLSRENSMVGGSAGIFDSKKIGRKSKLKTLRSKIVELNRENQNLKDTISSTNNQLQRLKSQNYKDSINTLRSELRDIEKIYFKQLSDYENSRKNIKSIEEILLENQTIIDNINNIIAADSIELNHKLNERELLEGKEGNNSNLNALAEELSIWSAKKNELNIEFIKQENILNSFKKEEEYLSEKFKAVVSSLDSLKFHIEKEIEKESDGRKELQKLVKTLETLYIRKKEESKDLGEVESSYFDAKHIIASQESEIKELQKKFVELQSNINYKKDKLTDSSYKIDGIRQRLQIEFEVNVMALALNVPEDYNVSDQEIKIEKLKNRLDKFGAVNPLAVEAYEEMEARKENIEIQKKDILDAKDQLVDTIKEIEDTATMKFLESFEAVRQHFKTVFRSLFTEDDTCDLILLDPDNPLSSDIEIIAKPKGKRPQSLSQLSGGEKTLTASALLFSLYLLKPAPFCVFDEVDAPLDDHNVQKFANIIRAFSQDSQFLVVTHNKATMAELDVLYGVYMEEKGVSSISKVDFRNFDYSPILRDAVG